MKLHYYRPEENVINFGDELNRYIWEHYFPNFFNEDSSKVFFGIGTILRAAKKYYPNSEIVIFGSGAHSESQKLEANFNVLFVRGPLTAKALGINKWITDPGILTSKVFISKKEKTYRFSYMPHFSTDNNYYKQVIEKLGIQYISPKLPVEEVIKKINKTEILITEAMHGAIVADTYRVPWIPVKSYQSFNYFKWNDWTQSMNIKLTVSTLPRLYESMSGIKKIIKEKLFSIGIKKICKLPPSLSDEKIAQQKINELENEIFQFKQNIKASH